jgi:hypothetical protein
MADLGEYTIVIESPPVITCVVETITLVEAVPIAASGATGAQGEPGEPGATGAAGAAGSVIRSGSGIPANDIGVNGDWYIDEEAIKLYGPKAAGVYPAWGLDLQGPAGATGATGPAGSFSGSSSDDLPEGVTNLYYTTARAAAKADAGIRTVMASDASYNGTNNVYIHYVGLDVALPSVGTYTIRVMLVCKTISVSMQIGSRFETSAGLVVAGVTGDPSGLAQTNSGFVTQTITTGSPTIINGPVRSNSATANIMAADFVVKVTTPGTLRTCMYCVGVVANQLTVCAGSFIEARKTT